MSEATTYAEPLVEIESESPWERRARWYGPVVILVCALLAYANSFGVPFVFDGASYVQDNPLIRKLWPIGDLLHYVKARPVGFLTFALNYAVAEYDVISWHITNLLIHAAAACALFGIARRTFASPRLAERYGAVAARLALAVAVVWTVHPLCTQSVTYLYQRLESLMGMFYLGTLYAFVRYAERGQKRWAAVSLASALLAMMTKEVAVTAPLMVLWYDRAFVADDWGELLRRRGFFHLLLWATLLVPAALIAATFDQYPSAGILDTTRVSVWEYARTQPEVVQHYLRLAIFPVGLNLDYAWPIAPNDWRHYGPPLTFIGGLLVLTLIAVRVCPPLGFLGGWWFVILAPTSSFAPIIDLAFEHRTYLSLISVVTLVIVGGYEAVGWIVRRCGGGPIAAAAWRTSLLLVLVAGFTTLTLLRNLDYRSELAIWRDVRFKVPKNARGHYNYGVYLQLEGSPPSIEEAIREYYETLRLDPKYADAYLNLGSLAAWKENPSEAADHYRNVLQLRPDNVFALVGLGDALFRLDRPGEARPLIERALQLEPNHVEAKLTLERLNTLTSSATGGPTRP